MGDEDENEKEEEEELQTEVEVLKEQGAVKMVEEKGAMVVVGELQTRVYPPPLLSHEELAEKPMAFMDVLRSFHSIMGTKFIKRIPVIGGKDLDLHLLYVQVTQRGGLEKVMLERRWREVIALFNFPSTTTSASFVLRKYYLSLLHHFEQVHFFGAKGPLIPPSDASQTKTQSRKLDHVGSLSPESLMARSKRRTRPPSESQSRAAPTLALCDANGYAPSDSTALGRNEDRSEAGPFNFSVTGTIDGKFDLGYLVTVKINSQILKGVLYHTFDPASSSSYPASATSSNAAAAYAPERGHRRKRYKYRDPAHPKPNRSAYNFFFAEKHSQLKTQYPLREREFSKMIGQSWNKLTEEERMIFQDISRKDKERYKSEMQEYKERLRLGQPGIVRAKEAMNAAGPSSANANATV